MSDLKLFREEALESRRARWYGDILLTQPPIARVVVAISVVLAALVVGLLYFGSYTRRVTVAGQLVPVQGVAKIYVQQPGVVVENRVVEGQRVQPGEVLFVVSSEQRTDEGDAHAVIAQQAEVQKQLLLEQAGRMQQLRATQQASIQATIDRVQQELPQLESQIQTQKARIALAQRSLERYQQLQEKGYVTQDQIMPKQAELLDQQRILEGLQRERTGALYSLKEAQAQRASVPLNIGNQIGDMQRAVASIEQTIVESELRRQVSVVAPVAGVVSAVTARKGQWVDGGTPLASLTPGDSSLYAELYAPSRAVGMMRVGDAVHLRYQAFPYQKFGQSGGQVEQITTVAMSSAELTRTNAFETGMGARGEPLYRITVRLSSQTVAARGEPQALRAGMLLDADVRSETRRLYEWALEPLYSIGKKL